MISYCLKQVFGFLLLFLEFLIFTFSPAILTKKWDFSTFFVSIRSNLPRKQQRVHFREVRSRTAVSESMRLAASHCTANDDLPLKRFAFNLNQTHETRALQQTTPCQSSQRHTSGAQIISNAGVLIAEWWVIQVRLRAVLQYTNKDISDKCANVSCSTCKSHSRVTW